MKKFTLFLGALLITMVSMAAEATISFADVANRKTLTNDQQVWEQNGLIVTGNKSASTTNVADYSNPARFYQGSSLTIKCTLGNITKIVIDGNPAKPVEAIQTSIGEEATIDGNIVTVIPKNQTSDTYVIEKFSAQVRINAITVTYTGNGEAPDDGGEEPETPDTPEEPETPEVETVGDGTEANPFTVEDVIALNNTLSGKHYVKAYIVGQAVGQSFVDGLDTEAPFVAAEGSTQGTNLAIASSLTAEVANMIPVQLPKGALRNDFNLVENPDKLGAQVLICGDLIKYFNLPGIKNTTSIVTVGDTPETPDTPEEPVVPKNLGAKTIAEFLALKNTTDTCVLTGVVANIANTEYGNFDLVDATGTVYVYGLLTAAGKSKQFASMDIVAGDTLTVKAIYNEYNSKPQAKNAIYVSHTKTATPVVPENLGAKTIAEFLALKNTTDTCVLTGVVANIANTEYGNFDLVDATGTVYVYGLLTAAGKSKQFASMDIVAGDTLTVKAIYNEFNSKPQAKNAIYVSHSKLVLTVAVTSENGTVNGLADGGKYVRGAEATLTATPASGYKFVNWTSGETVVSTENPYKFTVTADVALVANFKAVEPENEWNEMPLEITNLTTEVMEVEGAKFLLLMGRDDMNDADVTLVLNNYADVDDDYEVNAESSYMTFGGLELTIIEGVMTQTSETAKGTIYEGAVRATVTDEEVGGTMYLEFALTMYAAPATVLVLTDAIVAINEELGTLTFNVPTGEGEGYFVELSGYTAPGVHEGPQICLFETPEVVAFTNYAETSVADGVITLKGEFTSPMGPKFDLTISGTLPNSTPDDGGETPANVTFDFTTEDGLEALGIAYPTTDAGNGAYSTDLEEGKAYSQNGISLTAKYGSTATRIWLAASGKLDLRHYKGGVLTFAAPAGKVITNIVFDGADVTGLTTLVDKAWTGNASTVEIPAAADAKTIKINTITIHVADASSDYVATPTISGEADFLDNTTVTITAEEGLEVYYTLDGTDPTKASTKYTAPFELTATTTVKAVAYNGDKASAVAEKTFTKMTILTCAEAVALCTDPATPGQHIIRGYITEMIEAYNDQYKNITFWMADTPDGGQVLQAFRVKPVSDVEQALKVGDFVEVIGSLILYTKDGVSIPEVNAGGSVKLITAGDTAVDNLTVDQQTSKFIENGQLVILKDGVRYNALGQVIK